MSPSRPEGAAAARPSLPLIPPRVLARLPEHLHLDWLERAAILEHDAGFPREEAEERAFQVIFDRQLAALAAQRAAAVDCPPAAVATPLDAELVAAALARAGELGCECRGECGDDPDLGRCCAPHLQWIVRHRLAPWRWRPVDPRAKEKPDAYSPWQDAHECRLEVVVVDVAAAAPALTDVRALCPRCARGVARARAAA